ncbi:MAG: hypothetical protein LBH95_09800 [Oscillospiraceae bacterium]|nr:hypothetical protein [Oscillospiraceae bacterium]
MPSDPGENSPAPSGPGGSAPAPSPEESGFPGETPPEPSPLSVRELLGLGDVRPAGVEGISFIQNRETQKTWHTSGREIISQVMEHFDALEGDLVSGGASGGAYLWMKIELKDRETPVEVTVSTVTLYRGSELRPIDGMAQSVEITGGAKTEEEWEAILAACERVP